MKQKFFFLILAFLFMGTNLFATDYYVSPSTGGLDTNDGSSLELAFATLSKAITSADDGDKIIIEGTVNQFSQIAFNKAITFEGISNAVINGNTNRLFSINSNSGVSISFSDITFQNMNSTFQGAVLNSTSQTGMTFTFTNCNFLDNSTSADAGGGVFYFGQNPIVNLTSCTFNNNAVVTSIAGNARGGAISFNSTTTATITNCTFSNNKIARNDNFGGAAVRVNNNANITISNSLFYNNKANNGEGGNSDFNGVGGSTMNITNSLAVFTNNIDTSTGSDLTADFTNTTFTFTSPNLTYTTPTSISDATPIDFGSDNSDAGSWDSNINLFDGSTDSDWATATNWSSTAIPLATDNVTLLSDSPALVVSTTTGAVANDLAVDPSSSLVINSGGSLIVNGESTGNVTYNVNVTDDKWHLVSSPVVGEQYDDTWITDNEIESGSDTATNRAIATYQNGTPDGATGPWTYFQTGGDATTFGTGVGYSLKRTGAGDYSFTGTYPTTSITPAITKDNTDWNLIGNPYPSYINIETFLSTNSAKLDGSFQSIYVWNASEDKYDDLATGFVHPGQAFFLNAASTPETVSFTEAMQSHQTDVTFYKTENTTVIDLNLTSGENTKSTQINYLENKTTGLDPRFDIGMFDGVASDIRIYTQLISNNEGISFRRQALPDSGYESMVISVGVKAAAGKEITFSADALNLPSGIKVFLEDRLTNTFTRLDETNSEYKVTLTEILNGVGRFYIHTTESVLSTEDVILNSVRIFKTDAATLKITGLPQGKTSFYLYNILGKKMITTIFTSNGNKEISLSKLASGIYLAKMQTEKGAISKKIILE